MLLCSGKIRWDLMNARSQAGKDGQVAIIAMERLYPIPSKGSRQAAQALRAASTRCDGCRTSRPTRGRGPSWH